MRDNVDRLVEDNVFARMRQSFGALNDAVNRASEAIRLITDEANFLAPEVPAQPYKERPYAEEVWTWYQQAESKERIARWVGGSVEEHRFREHLFSAILGPHCSDRNARREVYWRLGELGSMDAITLLGLLA